MELGLTDKVALVTGASGGIGQAIASRLAHEGARVAVAQHTEHQASMKLAEQLQRDDCQTPMVVDYELNEPTSITAAVDEVIARWQRLDILIASAWDSPGWASPDSPMENTPESVWHGQLRTSLEGTINTIGAVLPHMRARGWGRVVVISSGAAEDGAPGLEAYAAAKAALRGLVLSLARNAGKAGVLTNAVLPGLIATERHRNTIPQEVLLQIAGQTPTGRLTTEDDVANVVAFLASVANASITGASIRVSGGLRM